MKIRLSTKLILSLIAIEAAMLFLLVWNSVRIINNSHTQILEQTIQEETELLANALSPGLAAQDRALLNDTLSLLKKNHDYVYALVYDYNGEMLAAVNIDGSRADAVSKPEPSKDVIDIKKEIHLAGQHLGTLHAGYSMLKVTRLTRNARTQNTLLAFLALIFSIIATIFITIYMNKRLGKLAEGAKALGKGNLQHRIDISGSDELTDLAKQFNNMAESLAHARIELEEKNRALEIETSHLQTLMNSVNAVVLEAEPSTGRFIYVSDEAEKLLGYPEQQWHEPDFWFTHVHPQDIDDLKKKISHASSKATECTYTLDYRMQHIDGHYIWVRSINNLVNDNGTFLIRGLLLDITEEKQTEQHIIYLAEHDALTGLLNRRRFEEELEQHVALAKRYNYEGAVLFIDLDQFKYINDSLGHHGGDEYLIAIAQCLQKSLRETDILGRLGGDEFGIIMARADEEDIANLSQKILTTLSEQVLVARGLRAQTSASIGIAIYPRHGNQTDDLLAKADAAMYGVKAKGRNNFTIYDDSEQQLLHMRNKVQWEDKIRHALKNNHFHLYFQPIVDVISGHVKHHEVLLRMYDTDTESMIPPGAFLETAERFGLIREIDLWVIENAIRILAANPHQTTGLSINISGRNFGDINFLNHIKDCIQTYKANTKLIIFEVTETAAVDNIFKAQEFVEDLRLTGCRFALDDFGVGFSSLHYLRNFPVDFIKIDGSFIRNLDQDKNDQIMVKAITHIAKGLAIQTVAECVEDEHVYRILKEIGVDMAQGYYIDTPRPELQINYDHLPAQQALLR